MKFLKGLALSILVVIVFLGTVSTITLLTVKKGVSKDAVKETITNLEIEKLVEENPDIEEELKSSLEPVYDTVKALGIDEKVIVKIINSDEVKGLIGDVTGNILDYIVTGEDQKIINADSITTLVSKAIDDINESGFYEFKEEQKNSILNVVQEEVEKNSSLIPDTSYIEEELDVTAKNDIEVVRFILGDKLVTYILIVTAIAFLGIVALEIKKAKWIKWNGITILIGSLSCAFGLTLIYIASNMLLKEEFSYIYKIFSKTANYGFMLSLGIAFITIVALVIYSIVINRKESKKEEA